MSYGAPNIEKVEINVKISKQQIETFINSNNYSTESFLEFLGLKKK